MRKIILFCSLIVILALILRSRDAVFFPQFEEAHLQPHFTSHQRANFNARLHKKRWKTLSQLYARQLLGRTPRKKKTKIPKILHQICLEDSLPKEFLDNRKSWIDNHPDWEYRLWTRREIDELYLDTQDNLAFQILSQFGGVFVDLEMSCQKPLDVLVENTSFFAGLRPTSHHPQIGTTLVGSIPAHPLLKGPSDEEDFTKFFFKSFKQKENPPVILPSSFFYAKSPDEGSFAVNQ